MRQYQALVLAGGSNVDAAAPDDRFTLRYESKQSNDLKLKLIEFVVQSRLVCQATQFNSSVSCLIQTTAQFENDEIFPCLIAASCGTNHAVADTGATALKRVANFNLEKESTVDALYRFCLGDTDYVSRLGCILFA